MRAARDSLAGLKSQKAFLGLSELIDWVLSTANDRDNDFRALPDFLAFLVVDKLFTDGYLAVLRG